MLAENQLETLDPRTLEARSAISHRGVLSLICRSTGRRRTPDERRHLDVLVGEIPRRAPRTPRSRSPQLIPARSARPRTNAACPASAMLSLTTLIEPHTERHRRIPPLVDDAVEVIGDASW